MLSFSGAFLFALTVTHLIPDAYSSGKGSIGVFILIGFFIQIFLELLSEGIEHGHIHVHKHQNAAFPYGMMIGLCLHSFLEGLPLAQELDGESTRHSLLAGIVLHHIPVAVALMTMLLDSQIGRLKAFGFLTLFALMAPIGAYSSGYFSDLVQGDIAQFHDRMMGIVIGIFLHISTTILFESSEGHRFNYLKFGMILLGASLALIV